MILSGTNVHLFILPIPLLFTPSAQDVCHRYDFLVRLYWNGLTFFKLFFIILLGLITTPHVLYVHMTYVYSLSYVSSFTRSHGQEKSLSYYDLLLRSTTDLRTHSHPRFLLFPLLSHHPYTPHLCQSTTAPLGEGYHLAVRYGHPEELNCT